MTELGYEEIQAKKDAIYRLCEEANKHLLDNCDRRVWYNPEVEPSVVSMIASLLNKADRVATDGGDSDYDFNFKATLRKTNKERKIFYLDVQRLIDSKQNLFLKYINGDIPPEEY